MATLANTYAKPSRGHIKQLKEQLQRCTKGSPTYWTYAFATTVYLINCMPTPTLHLSSPFDKLFESPPNYTKLRVFGYLCYSWLRLYSQHKTLVPLLVFFLVTLQHEVLILSILVVIQFPQQINLSTLLLNRFHEATSKNYRSRLASPPELHLERAY